MNKDRDSASIDEAIEECGFGWFQIRLCLLCGMGYFAVGSEILAMVMTQSEVMKTFDISTSSQYSLLPFFANLASFLSAIIVGQWTDISGRKWPFITSIWLSAIFGICCGACSFSFWSLILFRSLVGFGLGGITVVDYIVMVESCPMKWKNVACQIVFVSGCFGVVYIAILGMLPLVSVIAGVAPWRVMMVLGAAPLIITAILRMLISTDTPKYLYSKGEEKKAFDLVENIRRTNSKFPRICWDQGSVNREKEVVSDTKTAASTVPSSMVENVKQVLRYPITVPLSIIWIVQSLVYWGLTIFLPIFLSRSGISPNNGLLCMAIAELPGVAFALGMSVKYGRIIALITCLSVSCLGATMTGVSCLMAPDGSYWNLVGITVFYMALIPIWGVLFVLTPELYSITIRGTGTGFQHMCKSVPSLFAPFVAAAILDRNEEYVFMFIWASVLLVGVVSSFWLKAKHVVANLESCLAS